jgi:hypothetical protein
MTYQMTEEDLKKETTVTLKLNLLQKRVDQMYWDWDRLSRSGQDTLDEIANLIGLQDVDPLTLILYEKVNESYRYVLPKYPRYFGC